MQTIMGTGRHRRMGGTGSETPIYERMVEEFGDHYVSHNWYSGPQVEWQEDLGYLPVAA